MLWCLIAWVQMQKQVRQMGSSLQMWPSPTWTQASWARSTSSVHIWRQMHRVWQTKCFCQGNGLCLVFCATLVLGVENWLVKEDGSERREETRCKDLSGSREALRCCMELRGGRGHPRELQAVQDSGGSSLGHPSTGIFMSCTLTKPLHFLPPAPQPSRRLQPAKVQICKTPFIKASLWTIPSSDMCVAHSFSSFQSSLKCHLTHHPFKSAPLSPSSQFAVNFSSPLLSFASPKSSYHLLTQRGPACPP